MKKEVSDNKEQKTTKAKKSSYSKKKKVKRTYSMVLHTFNPLSIIL